MIFKHFAFCKYKLGFISLGQFSLSSACSMSNKQSVNNRVLEKIIHLFSYANDNSGLFCGARTIAFVNN